MSAQLIPLPSQPAGVPWPTREWEDEPVGWDVDRTRVEKVASELLEPPRSQATGETRALLIAHQGRLVFEQYTGDVDRETTLISWSMAKSISHALVGILLREDRVDLHAPALVPAWATPGDARGAITLDHMLQMVDGLDFIEDYVDSDISSVIDMLFGAGQDDVAGYAEACPLAHTPGTFWNYSSGTANVVSALAGRIVGGGAETMAAFMRRELFDRIGMKSATARFDAAGHFIGSSFVWATARDFARFGLLYLRDGCWEHERILPAGWVDYARTPTSVSKGEYGAHWWIARDGSAVFHASGFRGQYIVIDPERDLVLVRLGDSTSDQRGAVFRQLRELVESFPAIAS